MIKIKTILKKILKHIIKIPLINNFLNLLNRINDNDYYQINVAKENFYFAKSNSLNEYRVNTFLTKEPETINWINTFKEKDIFWDIGANIGLYSIYASVISKCKVFSFEPSVFNLEILARNINLNYQKNKITIIPISISSNKSISDFFCSSTQKSGALSSFGNKVDQHGNELKSLFSYLTLGMSVDELIKFYDLETPDYIKIDVDGNEHLILQGAKEALKKCKGILLELSDDYFEQSAVSYKILKEYNFKLESKYYKSGSNQSNQIWYKI